MIASMRRVSALFLGLALVACQPAPPDPQASVAADPQAAAAGPGDAATADAAVASTAEGDTRGPDAAPAMPPPETVPEAALMPRAGAARLAGRVAYPSEELPAMRVCAVSPQDPGTGYCTDTAVNQPHYAIEVPPGAWWLLAWPRDTGAAGDPGLLSAASDCLGSGGTGCDDHALREVVVAAGEVREGLDINDWYYDPQATPPPMEPRGETLE